MPLGSSAALPPWHRMVRKLLRTIICIRLCLYHGMAPEGTIGAKINDLHIKI